jgi:hypothetical protein
MKNKHLILAPRLLLFVSVFASIVGCTEVGNPLNNRSSEPELAQTTAPPTLEYQPPSQSLQKSAAGVNTQEEFDQPKNPDPWLLRTDVLGLANSLWLNLVAILLGGLGAALAINTSKSLHSFADIVTEELEKRFSSIDSKREIQGEQVRLLQQSFQSIIEEQSRLASAIEEISQKTKSMQDPTDLSKSYLLSSQPSWPPQPAWTSPHQAVSPFQLQAEFTNAVNNGDRQVIKNETRAQLNITSASDNNIAMGRTTQTHLEEVGAGGSYLLVSISGESWLYPTEQTLKGFAQAQPSKGIFNYTRQPIPTPQVVTPARLEIAGSGWMVSELGTIAVPS